MRLVTFNVWVGQDPANLRKNLVQLIEDTDRPVGLALQEAHRFNGTIPGYTRHALETNDPDDSNNVLLIRQQGVQVTRDHLVRAPGPAWIGPKHGQRHSPRISPGVTLEVDDEKWILLDTHLIPNEQRNPQQAQGEWDALEVWANGRREDRPLAILADWNHRMGDKALGRFVHRIGGDAHLKGIDGAVTRNCKVTRIRELDKKYGSDAHQPVVLDLEAAR